MSVNHERRTRTAHGEVTDLNRRRAERLTLLLGLRDRLAILAAEYTAHDLDSATDVVRTVDEVESAIQGIAPRLHAQRWRAWLDMDVQLAHDATDPSASCSICRALSDPGWWSAKPNRVG